MSEHALRAATTAVLVVGGGMVGLSAGLFLQHLGVPFVLVERNREASPLPRSRGIHVRTMELFRQVGVEDAVQAAAKAAWESGVFGGARRGQTMLTSESLIVPTMEKLLGRDASPSTFCACPQPLLEPVLRRPLEERGGDVRFGCELVALKETSDGVEAKLRDARDGTETVLTASYVIAADGARSPVRKQLGIATDDTPAQQHLLNLYFRCDLTEQLRGRTFSQCEIAGDRVRGLFLSKNNTTEWSLHLEYDPAVTDPAAFSDEELVAKIQAAIGTSDLPVTVLARNPWSTAVRVAQRYRAGRVFLAGDAAHVIPPWGGFNGNTGVADAHDLVCKLADVLVGEASPTSLDSYEHERRPIAVRNGRQALLRTDFDARFGLASTMNHAVMAQLEDTGALLLRYRYPRRTEVETVPGESVDVLRAQTGTRFPHAWILRDGATISTLDLLGREPVLLVGRDVRFAEGAGDWRALTGLPDDGAVLVRRDGFVADRSDETLTPAET